MKRLKESDFKYIWRLDYKKFWIYRNDVKGKQHTRISVFRDGIENGGNLVFLILWNRTLVKQLWMFSDL